MNSKAEESDFREPELPADRVLALEAIMDAKGNKLLTPPPCHGYPNCCTCPPCQLRDDRNAGHRPRKERKLVAA